MIKGIYPPSNMFLIFNGTCRSVLLHNRSNVVARYQWKAFSSVMEEDLHREM